MNIDESIPDADLAWDESVQPSPNPQECVGRQVIFYV